MIISRDDIGFAFNKWTINNIAIAYIITRFKMGLFQRSFDSIRIKLFCSFPSKCDSNVGFWRQCVLQHRNGLRWQFAKIKVVTICVHVWKNVINGFDVCLCHSVCLMNESLDINKKIDTEDGISMPQPI